jgi:exodeoxyribonuclease VII large subunit
MRIRVKGTPFLHPSYGFSINVSKIRPVGEGSIKKAAELLKAKLALEGLFDESRKRFIDAPPERIGLISSVGSAAYHDFVKIAGDRWGGMKIFVRDVQVQGEIAEQHIEEAISSFNIDEPMVDVIVIIRGGGSSEDFTVFNSEKIVRSIASSRTPTVVAVGHEVDVSLAELVADKRCSTPTHAAEFLTLDRKEQSRELQTKKDHMVALIDRKVEGSLEDIQANKNNLNTFLDNKIRALDDEIRYLSSIIAALNPRSILKRGYAIVKKSGKILGEEVPSVGDRITIETYSSNIKADIFNVELRKGDEYV